MGQQQEKSLIHSTKRNEAKFASNPIKELVLSRGQKNKGRWKKGIRERGDDARKKWRDMTVLMGREREKGAKKVKP